MRRYLDYGGREPAFELPKNSKGQSVKLSRRAVEALKRHRAAQNEERLRLAALREDHDPIFPAHPGRSMRSGP